MLREQKSIFVDEMRRDIERAAGVLFLDYTGLKVQEVEVLRKSFRAANVKYRVVKNTLLARVLAGTSCESAIQYLKGTPTSVVIGIDDPVTGAKLTVDFAKEKEKPRIKGGIVEGKAIDARQAEALAKMPSKPEVQAAVLAQVLSPGRNLAGQIKGPAGKILGAILKLVENKEVKGA